MMKTPGKQARGKQARGWCPRGVLFTAIGAALMMPASSAANVHVAESSPVVAGENRAVWSGPWSRTAVQWLIVTEAVEQGSVPVPLALAIADAASGFQPRTVSVSGAIGVMQLHPDAAKSESGADAAGLRDSTINIRVGLERLARLHRLHDRDWELALSHFRGGPLVRKGGRYRAHDYTRAWIARVKWCWRHYGRDPLVRAWVREARGMSRFDADEFRPHGVSWRAGWRLPVCPQQVEERYSCDRSCGLSRTAERCDRAVTRHSARTHDFDGAYRFRDNGGWTAVRGETNVRWRREGRWIAIDGGRRFR